MEGHPHASHLVDMLPTAKKDNTERSYPESNRGRRNAPEGIRIRSANPYTIKPCCAMEDGPK
jgi:hypothetical protein